MSTVLVVDDDDLVRAVTVRMAKRLGHDVLEANASQAALALVRDHVGAIDLLLTDMVLGDGDGVSLLRAVQEHRPEIRALLMSGSGDGAAPGHQVLAKPFTFEELNERLRDLLKG
jgi:DNA-binding NtrC family response regulator